MQRHVTRKLLIWLSDQVILPLQRVHAILRLVILLSSIIHLEVSSIRLSYVLWMSTWRTETNDKFFHFKKPSFVCFWLRLDYEISSIWFFSFFFLSLSLNFHLLLNSFHFLLLCCSFSQIPCFPSFHVLLFFSLVCIFLFLLFLPFLHQFLRLSSFSKAFPKRLCLLHVITIPLLFFYSLR